VVVHGCVRDTAALRELPLGVRALAACPLRSEKRNQGQRDVPLRLAGINVRPGDYLYADDDGLIIAPRPLH
jgi:regulator of ribonuclease activity A